MELKKLFQIFLTCIYSLMYYSGEVNRNYYWKRFLNNVKINKYKTIISGEISYDRRSDAAAQIQTWLCDIPQLLLHNSRTYEFRGVISFVPGKLNLRTSVGHYKCLCKKRHSKLATIWRLKKKNLSQSKKQK